MNRDDFIKEFKSDISFTEDERQRIIRNMVFIGGADTECVVSMEEMAELQQQISKFIRGTGDRVSLLEEMADVYICLDMLMYIYGIDADEMQKAIDVKLKRNFEWQIKGDYLDGRNYN